MVLYDEADECTTYVVVQGDVPEAYQMPQGMEECDAFIITLDSKLLSAELASEIAGKIVRLPVDWVETFGPQSEYLHDLVDQASVSIGRQEKVGDGDPMTAWHENLTNLDEVVSYLRAGGHGSAEIKLVVIIGPKDCANSIASRISAKR